MSKLNTSDSKIYISGKIIFISVSLLIILLVNNEYVRGQVYPNRNFTVRDGLVNSVVYAIEQDSAGFIWLGTENGLSRFDGVNFKNYTLESLNVGSFISSIKCISKTDLIFGTGNDGIYWFNFYTSMVTKINTNNVSQSNEIVIHDSILISLHEQHNLDMLSINSGTTPARDEMILNDPENKSYSILKCSDNRILVGRKNGLYELRNNKQILLHHFRLPVFSLSERNNGDILIGSLGAVYVLSENEITEMQAISVDEDFKVRNVIIDGNNCIWLNNWGANDIFMYAKGNTINVSEISGVKNTSVTRIFQDRDGNIWIGTIGKGVYLFTNIKMSTYPSSRSLPSSNITKIIGAPNGGLLIGTNDGIAHLDTSSGQINFIKHLTTPAFVKDIERLKENEYVIGVIERNINIIESFNVPHSNLIIRYCQASSLDMEGSNLLAGNWDNCFRKYDMNSLSNTDICNLFPDNFNKVRINSILRDRFGSLWIGSQKGILVFDSSGKSVNLTSKLKNENVISISNHYDGKISVITGSGFVIFENSTSLSDIRVLKEVNIPLTTCVTFIRENEYLVGTLNGIVYHFNGKEKLLSVNNGILSENVNCIYHSPGSRESWVGTAEGLIKINLDGLLNSLNEMPSIQYLAITHNDTLYNVGEETLAFKYSNNPIVVQARAFDFQNPNDLRYYFRHNNGNWTTAPSGELHFASLQPGINLIEVCASVGEGRQGPVSTIILDIIPPFYRSWWFYSITVGAVVFTIIWVFMRILKSRRIKQDEKIKTKRKLVELQQKALASSLNPHFVFNSLNSIQHFINANKQEDANNYLAKFSRLMRLHLNMADKSFISIKEEVERLEFYLNLEQMRFGKKMNWSITVDEKIDIFKTHIPNMIIQPFVENAIWHGIMPMVGDGIVTVEVKMAGVSDLIITISDNGVGYGYAKHTNGSAHESKGIKLITERLSLLDPDATNLISFRETIPGLEVIIKLTTLMYHTGNSQLDYQRN